MKTALATDEPDEPERRRYLMSIATGLNNAATTYTGCTFIPTAQKTTASGPNPWQCPDSKTWLAPTVTEHRCA